MKRIGIVLNDLPGYSETFLANKINGLISSGFDVELYIQARSRLANLYNWSINYGNEVNKRKPFIQLFKTIIIVTSTFLKAPKSVRLFYKLEKESGRKTSRIIENIYINAHILTRQLDYLHFSFATLAIRREHVAKSVNARMSVSLRGYDINVYPTQHPGCYQLLWKYVVKVHSISNDLYVKAISLGLSRETPFQIIYPAIDTIFFKPSDSDRELNNVLKIFTTARLTHVKGISIGIGAMALLKEKGVRFQYHIAGEGELKEELITQINSLQLQDLVFLVGKKTKEELLKFYQTCDLYIQPSIEEGFCNGVLEAQACGALCIVSDAGGLPENVVNNKTGWVIPKNDPQKFAQQISDLILLPDQVLARTRTEAIARVRQEFNLDVQQKAFNEFYGG